MEYFTTISELKSYLDNEKNITKSIGLVPTMGYLHEGHLSLIKASSIENDISVVSIFVNPTQFGVNEDLSSYPRNIERDLKLAEQAGANIIFAPTVKEMYPDNYNTYVHVNNLTETLCGASRPGHFKGVTTIVTKLFNIACPNRAYFGQKDAQQVIVIKQMVADLNMNIKIITCPIVREKDGLAMSSRNTYLSPEERKQAPILYQSLQMAKQLILNGEKNSFTIRKFIIDMIKSKPSALIDYVSIVNVKTLKEVKIISDEILIALAVKIGKTRLIDNIQMEVK